MSAAPPAPSTAPTAGRIFTFYSYKGGTGRSMALANVAWILASLGMRVLVIDWDLEAPGIHRYFRPFFLDPEFVNSDGLIDFFVAFAEASRLQHRGELPPPADDGTPWFHPFTDLSPYSVSLEVEFPGQGTVDFVCAGRQGASYELRVGNFQWGEFYERLGGGLFLEAVKARLRGDYDYVLIDSRTGLNDTSGICTIQMPDELVVFFTYNRQSTIGAAVTAQSAMAQRRRPDGGLGLKVWPVASRVEQAEKERLETARTFARESFASTLWHVARNDREAYWGRMEVPYVPFYAYEEILATVADRPGHASSLLAAMEALTLEVTGKQRARGEGLAESERKALLRRYNEKTRISSRRHTIFFSYSPRELDRRFDVALSTLDERLDVEIIDPIRQIERSQGLDSDELTAKWIRESNLVVHFVGNESLPSWMTEREFRLVNTFAQSILIVILERDTQSNALPPPWRHISFAKLSLRSAPEMSSDVVALVAEIPLHVSASASDPDDPQKGRWGGLSRASGRALSAHVEEVSSDWFAIDLTVQPTDDRPLTGSVAFHLHPSFGGEPRVVDVVDGAASLRVHAYGAFTVGVEADGGSTRLEIDLAELADAPQLFRDR
jgi:hypothetical protein